MTGDMISIAVWFASLAVFIVIVAVILLAVLGFCRAAARGDRALRREYDERETPIGRW